jgi:hypothetical protein
MGLRLKKIADEILTNNWFKKGPQNPNKSAKVLSPTSNTGCD